MFINGELHHSSPWVIPVKSRDLRKREYKEFLARVLPDKEFYDIAGKLRTKHQYGEGMKLAYEKSGITLSQFCKAWNKVVLQEFVEGKEELISKLCFSMSRKPQYEKVLKLNDCYPLLQQAVMDNQNNLLPILFEFGASPQYLKKALGKGLWKKLCGNSFYRNKLIIMCLPLFEMGSTYISDKLERLNKLPSSQLSYGKAMIDFQMLELFGDYKQLNNLSWEDFKSRSSKVLDLNYTLRPIYKFNRWSSSYRDYFRMCDRLQIKPKLNLLEEGLEEEHNKVTREYNLLRDKFYRFIIKSVEKLNDVTIEGVGCKCLKTPEQLHIEGKEMKHCVYSYVDNVRSGKSIIYSLTSEHGRSTLELRYPLFNINISKRKTYLKVNQHKSQCNGEPPTQHSEIENRLVKFVEEILNGQGE